MLPSGVRIGQYFCMVVNDHITTIFVPKVLKGKSLLDYTNLFCPNEYYQNDKTMLNYFQ